MINLLVVAAEWFQQPGMRVCIDRTWKLLSADPFLLSYSSWSFLEKVVNVVVAFDLRLVGRNFVAGDSVSGGWIVVVVILIAGDCANGVIEVEVWLWWKEKEWKEREWNKRRRIPRNADQSGQHQWQFEACLAGNMLWQLRRVPGKVRKRSMKWRIVVEWNKMKNWRMMEWRNRSE